jgi:hypothetical protein
MQSRRGFVVLELTVGLLIAAALALMVYCLVETIDAPRTRIRLLPVRVWQVLLLVPFAGPLSWLLFGRPQAGHRVGTTHPRRAYGPAPAFPDPLTDLHGWPLWPTQQTHPAQQALQVPRAIGPDDDPDYIAELARRVERMRLDGGYPARTDDVDDAG